MSERTRELERAAFEHGRRSVSKAGAHPVTGFPDVVDFYYPLPRSSSRRKPGAPKGRTMAESAAVTRHAVELINAGHSPAYVAGALGIHTNSLRRRLAAAGYRIEWRATCIRTQAEGGNDGR